MKTPLVIQGHFLHHPYSGQGVFLRECLKVWSAEGYTLEVLVWYQNEEQKRTIGDFLESIGATPRWFFFPSTIPFRLALGWWEMVTIPKVLRDKQKAHHYFSPSFHPMLVAGGPQTKSLQMVLHDTFLLEDASYTKGRIRKIYNALLRRTAKNPAIQLWTVSETSKQAIESLLTPVHTVCVAGCGIDHLQNIDTTSWKDLQQRFSLEHPYILYQGGYDERKNVPMLIDAFQRWKELYPKLHLVLCGNSLHATSLYTDVERLAQVEGIIHTGFVSSSDLRGLFQHAEVVVSPSRAEGFNIVVGEALMEKTPVLASDIPVHRELWSKYVVLTHFANEEETDAAFIQARSMKETGDLLPQEQKKALSWLTQAGKISATFV